MSTWIPSILFPANPLSYGQCKAMLEEGEASGHGAGRKELEDREGRVERRILKPDHRAGQVLGGRHPPFTLRVRCSIANPYPLKSGTRSTGFYQEGPARLFRQSPGRRAIGQRVPEPRLL